MKRKNVENICITILLLSTGVLGLYLWMDTNLLYGSIGLIIGFFILRYIIFSVTEKLFCAEIFVEEDEDQILLRGEENLTMVWWDDLKSDVMDFVESLKGLLVSFILLTVLMGIISFYTHTVTNFIGCLACIIILIIIVCVGIYLNSHLGGESPVYGGTEVVYISVMLPLLLAFIGFSILLIDNILNIFGTDLNSTCLLVGTWASNNNITGDRIIIVVGILLYVFWYFTILREELDSYNGGIFGLLGVIIFPFVGAAFVTGIIVIIIYLVIHLAKDIILV